MKKIYWFLLLAAALQAAPSMAANGGDTNLKFIVMTDIHFGRFDAVKKVSNSLDVLTKKAGDAQALFVTGDLTDAGHQAQYDQMKLTFDKHAPSHIPCYYVLGNHDRYNDKSIDNSRFSQTFGQPADTMVVINGYYFIMLSMRYSGGKDIYDRDFLSQSLALAQVAAPSKPIFLMYHVPVENTIYGSYEIGGKDSWGTNVVADILSKYPTVFAFSGHSHYPIRDERSIHQGAFTSVNVGTSTYAEYERGTTEGYHPQGYLNVSEGLIVEVKDSGEVVITRYDTMRDQEILSAWVVRPPYPGKPQIKTDKVRPRFARSARVNITHQGDTKIEIAFPQAWSGSSDTHHYRIILFDKNNDPIPNHTFTIFSGFHLGSDMPDQIKFYINNLDPEGIYRVMVTAVDSFGNYSKPLMSSSIKFEL